MKKALLVLLAVVALLFAPGTTQAADITDGALGIPWGASPAQARQVMEKNNYTFLNESFDAAERNPIFIYKGMYASYRAEVNIKFEHNQMFELRVILWEEQNLVGPDEPFRLLERLLTEKYGPWTRDASRNIPVQCSRGVTYNVPNKTYQWNNVGADGLDISLLMHPKFSCPSSFNWDGEVNVTYGNIGLYKKLKTQSQQNI